MNRYRRQEKNYTTILKDYAVPLVGLLLVSLFIYSIFSGGESIGQGTETPALQSEQRSFIVSLLHPDTKAQVVYSSGGREDILEGKEIFFGESVVVQEGRVQLSAGEQNVIHLNKIAEFKIEDASRFSLLSSDAWLKLSDPATITMRYASVTSSSDSILSLTQNEAGSTIYVLKGSAQVENIVGVQTRVSVGQRVSVPRLQASNRDFDITGERNIIDTFFKNSDWFLDNEGHLLNLEELPVLGEGVEGNENFTLDGQTQGNLIRFDRLRDEMSIESGNITISGTLLSENVGAISIQNTPADIDIQARSFSFDSIVLRAAMNDLVIKIYDNERNILQKNVITIYTSKPSTSSTPAQTLSSTQASSGVAQVTQQTSGGNTFFDVDATKFRFTSPSTSNRYTTTSSEITIRGQTSAEGIKHVEVNGFRLNSFNGSTWRYHAFERFDTIREGTNQYRIDYLDTNERLVYTDYYTIIKQAPGVNTAPSPATTSSPSTSPIQDTSENEGSSNNTETIIPEPEALFGN